jgi:ribonuclease G
MGTVPPGNHLVINRTGAEVRVALVRSGQTAAYFQERGRERSIVGNVYKGKVVRVVPGMQAAFVDIGLERAAFLYVGDIAVPERPRPEPSLDDSKLSVPNEAPGEELAPRARDQDPTVADAAPLAKWAADAQQPVDGIDAGVATTADERLVEYTEPPPRPPKIEELLKPGQSLVVQVRKEPLGTKGPRVTTQLALPGRFLVYLPDATHVGVSRRIADKDERDRLRDLVEGLRAPTEGFIVRTVCEGRDDDVLEADVGFLRTQWEEVSERIGGAPVPSLVYEEPDLVVRSTRDLMSADIDRLVVDDVEDHARLSAFVRRFLPTLADRLQLDEAPAPLFERYGIDRSLQIALDRSVRLPSGGYIVIDPTEALTAIDVNTGRYTGGRDLEETTLKVNLEAARAVAEQVRLRDIGGLLVIDFIDMTEQANRDRLYEEFCAHLEGDPARVSVQMTRRRVREPLGRMLLDDCPACDGRGRLRSAETVAYDVLREIRRQVLSSRSGRNLQVRCDPHVAQVLRRVEPDTLEVLQQRLGGRIQVVAERDWHRQRFDVSFRTEGKAP